VHRPLRAFSLSVLASILLVHSARALAPANSPETPASPAKDGGAQKQPESLPAAQKPPADYSQEPIIYEQFRGTMRYENDGTGSYETRARIRVNTPAGLEKAGQLIFDYHAANERVHVREVKVIKPDGTFIVAGSDAVQDLSAPVARDAPVYSDVRQKHVTVPGLAVGDKVEFDVLTTAFAPLAPDQFWMTWSFVSSVSALDEQLDLNVPRDRPLKIKSPPGVEPTVRDEGDRRIYHWVTSNFEHPRLGSFSPKPGFDPAQILRGVRAPTPPQVMFSTFSSWEEIGTWYGKLESDRRIVTPEIRAQAEEIVHGFATEDQKAQALYEWVARNIRYVSLSFGVGRYQPHGAAEVLANRYGDCKDKATLLEALFAAEEIQADAVLINAVADVDPSVPSPFQFNHVITQARIGGRTVWLDSTSNITPYGYLLPQLRGVNALVVSTNPPSALVETPKLLAIPTVYIVALTGDLSADGKLTLGLGLNTRGDFEVLARAMMLTVTPQYLGQAMQQGVAAANNERGTNFEVSDLKSGDPTETAYPFHLEFRLSGELDKDKMQKEESSETEDAREIIESILKNCPVLSLLPGVDAKTNKLGKIEQQEVELGGPKLYSVVVRLNDASKTKHRSAKSYEVRITKDFAEYEFNAKWEGDALIGLMRLDLRVPEISKDQVKEYAAFVTDVANSMETTNKKEDLKPSIVVNATPDAKTRPAADASARTTATTPAAGLATSSAAPAPAPVAKTVPTPTVAPVNKVSPEVAANYQKALDEIKLNNWGNASQLLESVVKADPDNALAWLDLGRSLTYIRRYADGEVALRKFLEMAPADQRAYANLAWCLTLQRKNEEAAALLEKRIASVPNDGDAHRRLGLSYLNLNRGELAVAQLEKAKALLPTNPSARLYLGQAYLLTRQDLKAVDAFGEAIDLTGQASTRNSAAYMLAQKKMGLDSAEKWANQAVEEVEIELNQTTLQNIGTKTAGLASNLAAYWDTLGWIKVQQGNFVVAEKYLESAWQLADDSTIGYHLARAYEAQGRTADAIVAYVETLSILQASADRSDDEKDARARFALLLGGDSLVDARIAEYRAKGNGWRSIPIQNSAATEGFAEFIVMVGPESKVTEIEVRNPESPLSEMVDALRAVRVPQSFPDKTIEKLPRAGMLSCSRADQPCTFTLMPVSAAARVFAANSSSSDNP
jgi:Flp pilus assembly protein TadD/transglutaminase-like putative cysteine protease